MITQELTPLEIHNKIRNLIALIAKTKNKIASGRDDLKEKLEDLIAQRTF